MIRSIQIGEKNTYEDWGLILTKCDMGFPVPKTKYIDIPHGDGAIDLTETISGKVNYSNREGVLEFDLIAEPRERTKIIAKITAYLHGRVHSVIIPDDPNYIYRSRLTINSLQTSYMVNKLVINTISDPYKLHPQKTVVELSLVKNLIENSWDSFDIVGDTENLISDGWDSFSPYGSGKNYVDNWDFSSNDLTGWLGSYGENKIIDGQLVKVFDADHKAARLEYYTSILQQGEYKFRIKIKSEFRIHVRGWNNTDFTSDVIEISDDFIVWETDFNVLEENTNTRFRFYGDGDTLDKKIVVDWIQITPVDNQHLIVEKTPLGNGLTRIQTWGGKDKIKLVFQQRGIEKNVVGSLYAHNIGENKLDIYANRGGASKVLSKNEKEYITLDQLSSQSGNVGILIRTINSNDNLDFIASDPIINEGDKPNVTLLKEKLKDGRTHLRAYGGQETGKLRFIQASDKVGDPLFLSMNIENRSSDIGLNFDAPSTNDVIEKGHNGLFTSQTEVSVGSYKYIGVRTDTYLDIIADDPIFIESKGYPFGEEEFPNFEDLKGSGDAVAVWRFDIEGEAVVPKIETSDEITITKGETYVTLNKGTHIVPQLQLENGDTVIYIRGKKDTSVKFEFQERGL